jgi:hypothetical protein
LYFEPKLNGSGCRQCGDGRFYIHKGKIFMKINRKTILALLYVFTLFLFGYYFFMYQWSKLQIADIYEKTGIFEQMEEQILKSTSVEHAIHSFRYALLYYPHSPFQIRESLGDRLLETLRRNSVKRMITTLKTKFPEEAERGNSPAKWLAINDDILAKEVEQMEWYQTWYLSDDFFNK